MLFEKDVNYVKEKLPLFAAQNYTYRRAMIDRNYNAIFTMAAAGIASGAIAAVTNSPWNWATGIPAGVLLSLSGLWGYVTESHEKPLLEVSKNSLAQEHMDAADAQLKDERFRQIILNPDFSRRFQNDDIRFYLISPGP